MRSSRQSLLAAFERLIGDHGGALRPSVPDVFAIIPAPAHALAESRLASGETITRVKGVICSTAPEQLYSGFAQGLAHTGARGVREALKAFQHGRGDTNPLCAQSAAPLLGRSGSGPSRSSFS